MCFVKDYEPRNHSLYLVGFSTQMYSLLNSVDCQLLLGATSNVTSDSFCLVKRRPSLFLQTEAI